MWVRREKARVGGQSLANLSAHESALGPAWKGGLPRINTATCCELNDAEDHFAQ
jgi:hypothetical protein